MWLSIDKNSDFSIHNLPFGIFSTPKTPKRVGVALGSWIIDMTKLADLGAFGGIDFDKNFFQKEFLNDFMAAGKAVRVGVRQVLQQIFEDPCSPFKGFASDFLVPQKDAVLHMPVKVGDYTDFYSSEQHAFNVGAMFRDPQNALLPNWKHLPVAYHGRASSIFVSGTNFHRPKGQTCPDETQPPIFGPTKRLDIELEMATIIGMGNEIGDCISVDEAEEHVFGFLLFNDWSARDIQKWEYVPLGPFLAKNFFSSVSPWVVTMEALAPFRVPTPAQIPAVLPYLKGQHLQNFDVILEVYIQPAEDKGQAEFLLCRSNFKNMYWTVAQQIAHHTVNGCNLNVGDMLASGTISGKEPDSFGSLLELTWGGKNPITLPNGLVRKFVEDYDTIIIRGFAQKGEMRVGFGEVKTTILPAK
ncbi:fumarylacetoacetase [Runella salmonicolor]|uniref:fumarylacetoacetase n=1 Tax=Runella salmonicolor TaxID=2950278 RepID=A0ABT1FIA3_9BACT|nr:fumarylacetoacetase [Runella salmonicolor]MCP1381469.1 fumarylacetoacetase [Runella salmonicolor]